MSSKKIVNFKDLYYKHIFSSLMEHSEYKNPHLVPKLLKIVINMGVGEVVYNSKVINNAVNDLQLITNQKPVINSAKVSIAGFKLREGMKIGCKVTLRREKMFSFFERLVMIALPRIKNFKGISAKSFDGRGNITIGITEQSIFPEIEYDNVDAVRGLDITIVTSAKNDLDGKRLLEHFNLPFYE